MSKDTSRASGSSCTCTCYKEGVPYSCSCPCPKGENTGAASSSTSKIVSEYESKLAACKGDKECIARVEKEEKERLLEEKIALAKEKKETASATLAATTKAEKEIKNTYGTIKTGIENTTSSSVRDLEPDVWTITWVECKDSGTCEPLSFTVDNYTAYSNMLAMLTSQSSVTIYESVTPTQYINYYASIADALAACNTYCNPPMRS